MSSEIIPVKDIQTMASAIAKSGLFGMKTPDQALALMLIAQAEGMHPAIAARDYHVIQGRPALKADALLARFQAAGGRVEWHDYTDTKVSGTFSHAQGGSVTIDWDMARAKAAGLVGKDNWTKYPRQMLRSRVISEGIRTVYPGCSVGIYTVEEVQDMAPTPKAEEAEVIDETPQPEMATADNLAVLTTKVKSLVDKLPDADVITLRKIVKNGCTKEVYVDWMTRLSEYDNHKAAPVPVEVGNE